jgi:hypothetical protein
MPLRDHFHPPLSVERPWDGVHSAWASAIAFQLNGDLLPEDCFAIPQVTTGGRIEGDAATLEQPAPTLTAPLDFIGQRTFEVKVVQQRGGQRHRAAIQLISPADKDCASRRRACAVRCAADLQQGLSLVLVDVVTQRRANLHEELTRLLGVPEQLAWATSADLYATAYRTTCREGTTQIDVWAEPLSVGRPLPTLPLWLGPTLAVPLNLEESYEAACASLRIRT